MSEIPFANTATARLSPEELQPLARKTRLTGLVATADRQACWVYSGGGRLHGYRQEASGWGRIPAGEQETPTGGEMLVQAIPAAGVQFSKIIFECQATSEPAAFNLARLNAFLEDASQEPSPALLYISGVLEGFWLATRPGSEQPRCLALANGTWVENMEAEAAIRQAASAGTLTGRIYRGDFKNAAWQEIFLNLIFEWLTNRLLERFGELTGRVMIGAITREMLAYAAKQNLSLGFENTRLTSTTLFASPEEMARSHGECLGLATRHIEKIIGVGMMTLILRQLQNSLGPTYLAVARMHGLIFA